MVVRGKRTAVGALPGVLFLARELLGPQASTRTLQVFLAIGAHDGITRDEIWERVRAPELSIYRDLLNLGAVRHAAKPGLDFIYERSDPNNSSRRLYQVTQRGRAALRELAAAMAPGRAGRAAEPHAF